MIALTSCRPMGSNPEYDNNQFNAWASWQTAFSQIVYFNETQSELQSDNTLFIKSEPFPHLWKFVEWAAWQSDWCCVINADIVIAGNWVHALRAVQVKRALCFTSWRYEFTPQSGFNGARVVDCGIDIFAASPEMWKMVFQHIPENIRIGCQQWDSWMLGAFGEIAANRFVAVTNHKCVFHPKHGNRQYGGDVGKVEMMRHSVWPAEI